MLRDRGAFDAFISGIYGLEGEAFQRRWTIDAIRSVSAFASCKN
jgi:hypothetical protein